MKILKASREQSSTPAAWKTYLDFTWSDSIVWEGSTRSGPSVIGFACMTLNRTKSWSLGVPPIFDLGTNWNHGHCGTPILPTPNPKHIPNSQQPIDTDTKEYQSGWSLPTCIQKSNSTTHVCSPTHSLKTSAHQTCSLQQTMNSFWYLMLVFIIFQEWYAVLCKGCVQDHPCSKEFLPQHRSTADCRRLDAGGKAHHLQWVAPSWFLVLCIFDPVFDASFIEVLILSNKTYSEQVGWELILMAAIWPTKSAVLTSSMFWNLHLQVKHSHLGACVKKARQSFQVPFIRVPAWNNPSYLTRCLLLWTLVLVLTSLPTHCQRPHQWMRTFWSFRFCATRTASDKPTMPHRTNCSPTGGDLHHRKPIKECLHKEMKEHRYETIEDYDQDLKGTVWNPIWADNATTVFCVPQSCADNCTRPSTWETSALEFDAICTIWVNDNWMNKYTCSLQADQC